MDGWDERRIGWDERRRIAEGARMDGGMDEQCHMFNIGNNGVEWNIFSKGQSPFMLALQLDIKAHTDDVVLWLTERTTLLVCGSHVCID